MSVSSEIVVEGTARVRFRCFDSTGRATAIVWDEDFSGVWSCATGWTSDSSSCQVCEQQLGSGTLFAQCGGPSSMVVECPSLNGYSRTEGDFYSVVTQNCIAFAPEEGAYSNGSFQASGAGVFAYQGSEQALQTAREALGLEDYVIACTDSTLAPLQSPPATIEPTPGTPSPSPNLRTPAPETVDPTPGEPAPSPNLRTPAPKTVEPTPGFLPPPIPNLSSSSSTSTEQVTAIVGSIVGVATLFLAVLEYMARRSRKKSAVSLWIGNRSTDRERGVMKDLSRNPTIDESSSGGSTPPSASMPSPSSDVSAAMVSRADSGIPSNITFQGESIQGESIQGESIQERRVVLPSLRLVDGFAPLFNGTQVAQNNHSLVSRSGTGWRMVAGRGFEGRVTMVNAELNKQESPCSELVRMLQTSSQNQRPIPNWGRVFCFTPSGHGELDQLWCHGVDSANGESNIWDGKRRLAWRLRSSGEPFLLTYSKSQERRTCKIAGHAAYSSGGGTPYGARFSIVAKPILSTGIVWVTVSESSNVVAKRTVFGLHPRVVANSIFLSSLGEFGSEEGMFGKLVCTTEKTVLSFH